MIKSSSQSAAPRQLKNMTETANMTLDADLEFLNLKEVAEILRMAQISVYRLVAKRALPVYRACRKILFKRQDVLDYLERNREDAGYGGS